VASEFWKSLRRSSQEVRHLYDDLYPPVLTRQDWQGSVFARRSLGDNVPVELWYLAEHFLLAWSDWRGLFHRYLRYFGQPESRIPPSWFSLDRACADLASRLLRDAGLDEQVSTSWQVPAAIAALMGEEDGTARSLYHALVANHRRAMLLRDASTLAVEPLRSESAEEFPGPIWPRAQDTVQSLNDGLANYWNRSDRSWRDAVLWHLRQYQHATLALSWLLLDGDAKEFQPISALLHAVTSERVMIPTIDQLIGQLDANGPEREIVGRALRRIQAAIAEVGYQAFVDDIASQEFVGGRDSPVGDGQINLIPSTRKGACCPVLVAVSKGDKRALGFPSIMQQVREHMIRCIDKTRVAIILCDHWHPKMLSDHLGDLRAHHDRGTRILFLLAGVPDRALAPVAVDLSAAP